VGPRPRDIFAKDKRVHGIFVYDKHARLEEKLGFIRRLRKQKYDMVIDMKNSLMPFLIGARYRTGFFSFGNKKLRHKKLVHLARLKAFGIAYKNQKNIYIDESDRMRVDNLLKGHGVSEHDMLIGISPASKSNLKQWKKEGFVDVIEYILKDGRHKVILIGDVTEEPISQEIAAHIKRQGIIDLTGRTTLGELCALMERLPLLVTGDSAALHIASDLGVKTIAIFGPTDPEEYGPQGPHDIVIRKVLTCSPCKKAQCKFGTHACMTEIGADEVIGAVRKALVS
jgi:ADP-heptose:LPS heptosyltransferase